MKKRLITFEWANNDFQLKKVLSLPLLTNLLKGFITLNTSL